MNCNLSKSAKLVLYDVNLVPMNTIIDFVLTPFFVSVYKWKSHNKNPFSLSVFTHCRFLMRTTSSTKGLSMRCHKSMLIRVTTTCVY